MDFLTQITQLLSDSPGNIVYHLVTLFALQAVFAISFSQWRRNPESTLSFRFAISALAIIMGRLGIVVLVLAASLLPWTTAVLPLLEQSVNTLTVLAVLWAIVPSITSLPRLSDLFVLIGGLIVIAMTISFYPSWLEASLQGVFYLTTTQATVWFIAQITLLAIGFLLVLLNAVWRQTLSPIIIGVLLTTGVFQLLNYPQLLPTDTHIGFWIRLGHFVAFPLWAVMAYRQSLLPMLRVQQQEIRFDAWGDIFKRAGFTAVAETQSELLNAIVNLSNPLLKPLFIAVAGVDNDNPGQMLLVSNQPQKEANSPRSWVVQIAEFASIQVALNQNRPIEINLSGAGAGQLHRFSEKLSLGEMESMIIHPVLYGHQTQGVFIIGSRTENSFDEESKSLAESLATYSGYLIANHRNRKSQVAAQDSGPVQASPPVLPDTNEVISGRIISLEQERDTLQQRLETAENKLKRAEDRAADSAQKAQGLVAAMEALQQQPAPVGPSKDHHVIQQLEELQQEREQLINNLESANGRILQSETKMAELQKKTQEAISKNKKASADSRIKELEREVEALRESLTEAEDAMAMAAAGQGDLSPEWVMLTITRYSGQLEQAQARIETLEAKLGHQSAAPSNDVLIGVIQELRTPMTSIAGFTDLLLGGSLGNLGVKQRDLLQRIQANADRMGSMLEQIMQLVPAADDETAPSIVEKVDVREAVETAVNSVMPQVREKRIHLDFDVSDNLPALTINRKDFHQIISNLLDNACIASGTDGNILLSAYPRELNRSDVQHDQPLSFIEITIQDSGDGISTEDLANVFSAHYNPEEPLIAGLGDTTAGLSLAHSLTVQNGGRLWVDSEKGKGSIFSLLFSLNPFQDSVKNGSIS
ncbi:MAG: ATP-binding protein [Chloroflexota bacterium]